MKNFSKTVRGTFYIVTLYLLGIATALPASAQLVNCGTQVDANGVPTSVCGYSDLFGVIDKTIQTVIFDIGIPVVVGLIIYGGILIMISAGNTSKVEKGKNIIKSAVVGLVIALLAWLIVQTILNIFFPKAT